MTGHFTTADGCEKWEHIASVEKYQRVPLHREARYDANSPFSTTGTDYGFRMYRLESIDYSRGLAHYVEVL